MLVVSAVMALVVFATVVLHYEALLWLHRLQPRVRSANRFPAALSVFGALAVHFVEIVLFALALYLLSDAETAHMLHGDFNGTFNDYVYYSFVVYTALGFGDITPTGHMRIVTGFETLTGLLMIAWTASFLFVQMQSFGFGAKGRERENPDEEKPRR